MDHPVEVEIHDVAYGGDGVGRLADGRAVFVPFSAVGDRLLVRLATRHRRFARGTIEKLLEPGPNRAEPRCPYYGECGGCCYQHLASDEQVRLKAAQLRGLLGASADFGNCRLWTRRGPRRRSTAIATRSR